MESGQASIKLTFNGEMHRLRIDFSQFTLKQLHEQFHSTFPMPRDYLIQYKDNEGDIVTISNDIEFVEACRVLLKLKADAKTLSFIASNKFVFKHAVEPVVKAVEDFADRVSAAATEMVNKTKEQEWTEKCCKNSKEALESLKKCTKETGDYLNEQRKTLSETEFCQRVKEFSEEVRRSIRDLLNAHIDQENLPMEEVQVQENEETQVQQQDAQVEAPKEAIAEVIVEVTEGSSGESSEEWDMVEPSQVDDRKWAKEYKSIREMFPEVQYEQCLPLLERCNGDIQVVINDLMDI